VSVIRQDLSTRDWTIFATERAKRPKYKCDVVGKEQVKDEYVESCPFCKGNEDMTPKEIFSIKEGDDWKVRVVPNKYPALREKEASSGAIDRHIEGGYLYMDGVGRHEVIIESPKHNDNLATVKLEQVEKVVLTYRQRFVELSKDEDCQLIVIFKNHGMGAGTSLEHPHSQIIATPFVPCYIRNKLLESQIYFDDFGRCVFCDIIQYEIIGKKRIICENEDFIAFAPYASTVPYNVKILPRKHESCFGSISEKGARSLASILRTILHKLYYLLDNPEYNYVIESSPIDKSGGRNYHWNLNILPRLVTRAGFEIGSGININTILPEDCAKSLRELK